MVQLTQENRQLIIESPLGSDALLIQSLKGTESISRLFQYEAIVISANEAFEGESIVGQLVSVTYFGEDGDERNITGYVSRFEYLQQVEEPAKLTSYQLTLVPWLWFLRHNRDCRMFHEMTAPDVIQKIFDDLGFTDYEIELNESYPEREYCVQYNETDFDFVSRLMEEEGIFYYFKHENGNHTLVLGDATSAYYDTAETEVSYTPVGQTLFKQLRSSRHVYEFRPGKVAQKDYDFKKPTDKLKTEETSKVKYDVSDRLEVYEYPGLYDESAKGKRLTKVRREALDAEHDFAVGSGFYVMFSPGGKFKMTDHSRKSEVGKSHVLVEVFTEIGSNIGFGNEGTVDFQNQFKCIPAETVYRPPRQTVKPVVEGPQTAIVVTDGQEIVVDEHARIKVQFHWDRYGENNLDSSCWIRVSQVHAGKGWGMMDIPRKDEEVIVSFLDGDPDRPIITGRVYNGDNAPPFELKGAGNNLKNKTRRGNMTKSYEANGFNEMTMDDTEGEEQIRIHAQYDMNSVVENDQTLHVKNNRTKNVDVDETKTIGNNQTLTVVNDKTATVQNNHTETVLNNQSVTVGSNQSSTIGKNQENKIGKSQSTQIAMTQDSMVGISSSEMVGISKSVTAGASISLTTMGNISESAGRSMSVNVGKELSISAGNKVSIVCGAAKLTMEKSGKIVLEGKDILVKGSGKIVAKATGDMVLKGSKIGQN